MNSVLVIDNFKIFEKWASKTYQYKIEILKKDKRFKVIDISELEKTDINNYEKIIFGWNMCIYSKYYTTKNAFYSNKIKGLENSSQIIDITKNILTHHKKYLIVQDFINSDDYQHGIKSLILYLKKFNFKGIITPYLNTPATIPLKKELPSLEIIHIPHHIDENKFKDWGLEKTSDIFIFGNCKGNKYPFRHRLVTILDSIKNKYNITFWNDLMSRNYFKFNNKISNENLSKKINSSWMTICTKSTSDALLGKYIETSMSGSIVLGNMPTDGSQIWNDNYININENMSDQQIISIIENALNDKEKLQNKINIMKEDIKPYYLSKFPDKIFYGLK